MVYRKESDMGLLDQLVTPSSGGVQQLQDTVGQAGGALEVICCRTAAASMAWWSVFSKAGLGDTPAKLDQPGRKPADQRRAIAAGVQRRHLNSLAEKAGIDPAQAGEWLSANLPEWVNQLTPNGSLSDLGGVFEQRRVGGERFFSKF